MWPLPVFKRTLAYIVVIVVGASALWSWYHPRVEVVEVFLPAPPPKVVTSIETRTVEVEKIVYLDKPSLERESFVPASVLQDDAHQVTAVCEVPPYKGMTTVTAVFDTFKGDTRLYYRHEPLAFFEFLNKKELGVRYGMGTGGTEMNIFGRWTFLRMGAIHSAFHGEIAPDEWTAMIEGSYRW